MGVFNLTELLNSAVAINFSVSGGLNYKGPYVAATAYVLGDVVSYLGSSYVAYQSTTNNLPTNTSFWYLLVNKGEIGNTGATGPGVVTGGIANQALTKIDGTDYNTQWSTIDKTAVGLGNVTNDSQLPLGGGTMTGALVLAAGTTSLAPIKLQAGTNLTTPTTGVIEFDGTDFYITV